MLDLLELLELLSALADRLLSELELLEELEFLLLLSSSPCHSLKPLLCSLFTLCNDAVLALECGNCL